MSNWDWSIDTGVLIDALVISGAIGFWVMVVAFAVACGFDRFRPAARTEADE